MSAGGAAPRLAREVLDAAACAQWLATVDACAARLGADHPDRQPTSDSLRLTALPRPWLADLEALVRERGLVAPTASCLHEQCWARRQHPPLARPGGAHPHHWHQDGALGARFEASAPHAMPATRPLTTVWIALTACGSEAPSLEWIDAAFDRLLQPSELDDSVLLKRHGLAARAHARLDAGDGLVFDAALLHRTHVTSAMKQRRVSVELRFVPATR